MNNSKGSYAKLDLALANFCSKIFIQVADNVVQLVSSLMSEPNVCKNGFDGPAGSEAGIQFLNGGAVPSFSPALAATEQNVTLPSNFPNGPSRLRLQAGLGIPNSNLQIDRLYVSTSEQGYLCQSSYTMCGGGSTYLENIYAGDARAGFCGGGYSPQTGLGGTCGSANGVSSSTAPQVNLCSTGAATGMTDGGSQWTWKCVGYGSGVGNCSATK